MNKTPAFAWLRWFTPLVAVLVVVSLIGSRYSPLGPSRVHAAGIVVNTNADNTTNDDLCSLREAITNANDNAATYDDCAGGTGDDTITFDLSGGNATIVLADDLPPIANAGTLQIDGTNAGSGGQVTIDGANNYRPFYVNSGANLTLANITVTHGQAKLGGAVYNDGGTLTIVNSTVSKNTAANFGGGIDNENGGTLTISNSTVSKNTASDDAGGGAGGGVANEMAAPPSLARPSRAISPASSVAPSKTTTAPSQSRAPTSSAIPALTSVAPSITTTVPPPS